MTVTGHAMPMPHKRTTQRLCDEIQQRLHVLAGEGWDVSDGLEMIRDINLALVEE